MHYFRGSEKLFHLYDLIKWRDEAENCFDHIIVIFREGYIYYFENTIIRFDSFKSLATM